jgi:putative addiction module killer protein
LVRRRYTWKQNREYSAGTKRKEGLSPLWIGSENLRDAKGRNVIRTRLNRIQAGNFGNCDPVGDGVQELKIDFGPGYRIYFGEDGDLVILLFGGDKDTQVRDIQEAKRNWGDYNA